jgi:hypothetical protein
MKSCPTCRRTFEDTFTFCLVDGSILSAPYDIQSTLVYPESNSSEPPPTDALPKGLALPPTPPSPSGQQLYGSPPQVVRPYSPLNNSAPKRLGSIIKKAVMGGMVGATLGVIIGIVAARPTATSVSDTEEFIKLGVLWGFIWGVLLTVVVPESLRIIKRKWWH